MSRNAFFFIAHRDKIFSVSNKIVMHREPYNTTGIPTKNKAGCGHKLDKNVKAHLFNPQKLRQENKKTCFSPH